MRESFRLNQDNLVGWDIVGGGAKSLGDLENPELAASSANFWKRLNA